MDGLKVYVEYIPMTDHYSVTIKFLYHEQDSHFPPVYASPDTPPGEIVPSLSFKIKQASVSIFVNSEWLYGAEEDVLKTFLFKKIFAAVYDATGSMPVATQVTPKVLDVLMKKSLDEHMYKVFSIGKPYYAPVSTVNGHHPDFAHMSTKLPGISEIVKSPCHCLEWQVTHTLRNTIMHLNDHHHWSRDAIADWLETLDIDLEFKDG